MNSSERRHSDPSLRFRIGAWRSNSSFPLALMAVLSCNGTDVAGECQRDEDCPAGRFCLYDAARELTTCSLECTNDFDCEPTRACLGLAEEPSSVDTQPDIRVCAEAVRQCGDDADEACDGLDNDCDGVIDDDCTPLPCTREDDCGAFSCIPEVGAEQAECAPTVERRSFYAPCNDGSECPNGICNGGFCSPACRDGAFENDCPTRRRIRGEQVELACAAQVLTGRPSHGACQAVCFDPRDCPAGTACAWRRILPSPTLHVGVCTELDLERRPLGSECGPSLRVEGDAQCQHGLCFQNVCTRLCGGGGADCSDVGPDFRCQSRRFTYQVPGAEPVPYNTGVCVEFP